MTDFNQAIQTALTKMSENGSIEKIIEDKLHTTIKDIFGQQLRSYSSFGKALEEKINEELNIDLNNVNFSQHNKVMLNLIEGQLNNAVTGEAQDKLKRDINELFKAPPKEITLSELIEKYKEESDRYDRDGADEIALIIEPKEHGSIGIALNPTNKKRYETEAIDEWTQCELYMSIYVDEDNENRGKLTRTYERSILKPHQFMPTCMTGTSRLLYQMYCAGSTLVLDQGLDASDYDTYYPEDEPY